MLYPLKFTAIFFVTQNVDQFIILNVNFAIVNYTNSKYWFTKVFNDKREGNGTLLLTNGEKFVGGFIND